MTFENAIHETNPEKLIDHILAGRDVVYFRAEDTIGKIATLAAAVFYETGSKRPISDMRNEAMRAYDAGLCSLVQRRTERRAANTTLVTVDYIAESRRKVAA